MEEFLIKIKNKISNLFSLKKENPHTHWNNLLFIFLFIYIILIIYSIYLLFKIKNEQTFQLGPEFTETPSLVNEKLLEKVNVFFNDKALKEIEIKEGGVLYRDPSI